jgi:hypothetical protein
MNPIPQFGEMKLDPDLEVTPRRSYEGLDPSELECAITRLRDSNFGVLLPCLHEFSVSGINALEQQTCPKCRSEIDDSLPLERLDKKIVEQKNILQKMEKAREKVAKINHINKEHLVGHAAERNDVKAAVITSILSEGDLPRLFGEEENAIPNENLAEINRLNRIVRLQATQINSDDSTINLLLGVITSSLIFNQIGNSKDLPIKFLLALIIGQRILNKIIDVKNPRINFLMIIVMGILVFYGSREAMKISYDVLVDLPGNFFLKFN